MAIIYINFKEIYKENSRKAKAIAKLHKKLKLKNATKEEINFKTLEYAKKLKDMYGFFLTDDQQNSPDFLLQLYKANPQALFYFSPNKELQNNVDFMLEYVKLELAKRKKIYSEHKEAYDLANMQPSLEAIIKNYRSLQNNPAFERKLASFSENE